MELQKPDYLLSLASAGILVNVECSTWGATKKDNKVTEEVTSAYKSDKDSADVVVNLMANVKEHKDILKYRNDIRNWLGVGLTTGLDRFAICPRCASRSLRVSLTQPTSQSLRP